MKPKTARMIPALVKNTYKAAAALLLIILFFFVYNTYLVDNSLVRLKKTLENVNNLQDIGEAKNLISALDYSLLAELSAKKPNVDNIARIGMAKDILAKASESAQLEDVKFVLNEVIRQKEQARPAILSMLERVGKVVAPVPVRSLEDGMMAETGRLEQKAKELIDHDQLQQAYFKLGNICSGLSDHEKAREAYEKALSYSPDSQLAEKIRFNLAWNEKLRGNLGASIAEFERIIKDSGDEDLINLCRYQLGEIYRQKGDFDAAIRMYQKISIDDKDYIIAQLSQLQTANTFLYDLKNPSRAKEVFESTENMFQGTEIAAYIKSSAIPKIVARYRQEGYVFLDEGKRFSQPQKFNEALRYFDRALEMNPKDSESFTGKAIAYLWKENPVTALELARRALKLSPDNEAVIINLGYIYISLGLVEEAIVEYKRFLASNPFSFHCNYNLGYAYAYQGELKEAMVALTKAIRINPNFAPAYNNYGWCLWSDGKYAEAISAFERAVSLQPKFLDAVFNLGEVYRVLGRFEEARRQYAAALRIDPANARARERLELVEKLIKQAEAVKSTVAN